MKRYKHSHSSYLLLDPKQIATLEKEHGTYSKRVETHPLEGIRTYVYYFGELNSLVNRYISAAFTDIPGRCDYKDMLRKKAALIRSYLKFSENLNAYETQLKKAK